MHRGVLVGIAICLVTVVAVGLNYWLSPAAHTMGVAGEGTPSAGDGGPRRIISLTPSTTEVIYALGLGDRLVGRSRFCDYPPEALEVPDVGGFLDPNYEAIAALRPDLVLLIPSHREHQAHLEQLGIPCTVVSQTTLQDILDSVRVIGGMCGVRDRADALVASIAERVEAVRNRVAGRPRPRALLSVGRDLGATKVEQIYAVGPSTFLGDLLDIAGATNIAAEGSVEYPSLTAEAIIRLNPQVVIELAEAVNPETGVSEADLRAAWTALAGVDAVRNGRIHLLVGDYVSIPGPRVAQTLEQLAALIHPESAPPTP